MRTRTFLSAAAATSPTELPIRAVNDLLPNLVPGTQYRLSTGYIGGTEDGELCDAASENGLSQCIPRVLAIVGLPVEDFGATMSEIVDGVYYGQVDIVVEVLER